MLISPEPVTTGETVSLTRLEEPAAVAACLGPGRPGRSRLGGPVAPWPLLAASRERLEPCSSTSTGRPTPSGGTGRIHGAAGSGRHWPAWTGPAGPSPAPTRCHRFSSGPAFTSGADLTGMRDDTAVSDVHCEPHRQDTKRGDSDVVGRWSGHRGLHPGRPHMSGAPLAGRPARRAPSAPATSGLHPWAGRTGRRPDRRRSDRCRPRRGR